MFLLIYRKKKSFDGELLLIYLILASVSRLMIEPFRADTHLVVLIVTFSIFIISVVLYFVCKLKQRSFAMKKSLFGLALLVMALAVYGACVVATTPSTSRGYDIKSENVKNIVEGKTTESEILKMFGPPAKFRNTAEGKQFFYDYARAGGETYLLNIGLGGGVVQKTLLVTFDKEGVVTNYAYKES
jgi:outer membrane protein assembly factor BamE (lipoprotein component of BamABCDE complex)